MFNHYSNNKLGMNPEDIRFSKTHKPERLNLKNIKVTYTNVIIYLKL